MADQPQYVIVFLATRWGSELGGINVFNTGLARGMKRILPRNSVCLTYIQEENESSRSEQEAEVRKIEWTCSAITEDIRTRYLSSSDQSLVRVLIVGHDVITGRLAIDCCQELTRTSASAEITSATLSHMDYRVYAHKKGDSLKQVDERSKEQHEIVSNADLAYAVGPYLVGAFQVSRQRFDQQKSPVHLLIPGAAEITPTPVDDSESLSFFVSGRLAGKDDLIKNGFLAIESIISAYNRQRGIKAPRWKMRGKLYLYGADPETDSGIINPLRKRASQASLFEIEAQPFSVNQEQMHSHLSASHVALMPSWHEGFGLTGWEALCAGVPLVCSTQSGLALLLDDLRGRLTDLPFDSVVYVSLAGSEEPGRPNPGDIDTISEALLRIIGDYRRYKEAALLLARRLKREYTWEQCAHDLIGPLKWQIPSSFDWRTRQRYASTYGKMHDVPDKGPALLQRALEACTQGRIQRDWSVVCSALNWISNLGKTTIDQHNKLLLDLREIGYALTDALATYSSEDGADNSIHIRNSGTLDLCWRFMAASSSISKSFRKFSELFSHELITTIFGDSFLQRELLYYIRKFSPEFEHQSKELAKGFLAPLAQQLADSPTLQTRLARLATLHHGLLSVIPTDASHTYLKAEMDNCIHLRDIAPDSLSLLANSPELSPSFLALSALDPQTCRQPIEQTLAFIKDFADTEIKPEWRGDKRIFAGILTSGIATQTTLATLEQMARDEEEAIRWAAISLAFSRTLRARLESATSGNKEISIKTLYARLSRLVDVAVSFDGGHPWLLREFFRHFAGEHDHGANPSLHHIFSTQDFPVARNLFGPCIASQYKQLSGSMHPEVQDAREAAREKVKRVLLVLPPIDISKAQHEASTTSTPPLGLGLLATYLSEKGHDVQLADCHRFPQLYEQVRQHAYSYDVIGFNVVLSTLRSAHQMLKDIRANTSRPVLIVGGPAAKLNTWLFTATDEEELRAWDFAVSEDEFRNVDRLLNSLDSSGPWPNGNGLFANEDSLLVANRDIVNSQDRKTREETLPLPVSWDSLQIDRRIYRGPEGNYEPGPTRRMGSPVREAHVVMSQGCDWNCSFCTERRELSHGETRRTASSVLKEIEDLAAAYPELRIQFIDDNLLPQIAAKPNDNHMRRGHALDWTDKFLTGLEGIRGRRNTTFSWRGIFRIEDFLKYEQEFERDGIGPKFTSKLVSSGCRMLAFGVETGCEKRRKSLKGAVTYANDDITELFERLNECSIFTKAYYILGGKGETRETAEQTIAFALQSGVTMAYFALYKDFVGATQALSKDERERSGQYLFYDQLWLDWDAKLSKDPVEKIYCGPVGSNPTLFCEVSREQVRIYRDLAAMGFNFSDLIKYNDFHSMEGPSKLILSEQTWQAPNEYFALVGKAYVSFYLREDFIQNYKMLIDSGY